MVDENKIKNISELEKFVKEKSLVLIDFYADWCGPCHLMKPVLKNISENYKDKIKIGKVDADTEEGLTSKYGIKALPYLMIFYNENLVERFAGLTTQKEIEDEINRYLN